MKIRTPLNRPAPLPAPRPKISLAAKRAWAKDYLGDRYLLAPANRVQRKH